MAVREVYEFAGFTLDARERRLLKSGENIPLPPKTHDVLVTLVRQAGRLVSKRELLDAVWPGAFVEEGILSVHISALRKALGSNATRVHIETVPRSGYRFVGRVTSQWAIAALPAQPDPEKSDVNASSLGFAIADALIDSLGRFPQLIVRPARAVLACAVPQQPSAVGRALQVDAVIESTYRCTAEGIRISARLIHSAEGARLWAGAFDEPGAAIGSIAARIAEEVAAHLGLKPESAPSDVQERETPSAPLRPEVYELFGRGRASLLTASYWALPKAVEAFRAAIELDPEYAAAYAGLALAWCAQAELRVAPHAEAYAQARAAALRALGLDNACADAQVALGAVLFLGEWDWLAAERAFRRALQLNPNHSEAYLLYGRLWEARGQLSRGLEMKLHALERDPFSALVHLQIAQSYWNHRRYDDAIEWASKALELDPRHLLAREFIAGCWWKKGDFDRQMAESLRQAETFGAPAEAIETLRRAYAEGGRPAVVAYTIHQISAHPFPSSHLHLAVLCGEAGDLDSAFRHLAHAISHRDPCLVDLAVAPQWDSLRGDPRFASCVSRIGLENNR